MEQLSSRVYPTTSRPIGIMQFGEGNFLRAFVDWFIYRLNKEGHICSNVVVVQPLPHGRVDALQAQDGLYTLCLQGIQNGTPVQNKEVIDVIGDAINPYTQYDMFMRYAQSPDLKLVISNTTEAGIALSFDDVFNGTCPISYPAKLLSLLYHRYCYFAGDTSKGLCIIPCELIDHNGDTLREALDTLSARWGLPESFVQWFHSTCHFTNTLVDRIVPGYPRDKAPQIEEELGYTDCNLVAAEVFHLWVLQQEPTIQALFPVDKLGALYVPDITPYKQRKVKVLNGAHTAMVPVAYLCGIDTVGEAMQDADVRAFVLGLLAAEVSPTIRLPEAELQAFVASVIERFQNPYVHHLLMSIALNSTTKFVTRLLPSYNDYVAKFHTIPRRILFAFSALAVFYRGQRDGESIALADSEENLAFWRAAWNKSSLDEVAEWILSAEHIWGQNLLTGETRSLVANYLHDIDTLGMRGALQHFLANEA